MKIRVGRRYLTRDGRQAVVEFYSPDYAYGFCGRIDESRETWMKDGSACEFAEDGRDLMSEVGEIDRLKEEIAKLRRGNAVMIETLGYISGCLEPYDKKVVLDAINIGKAATEKEQED